MLILSQYGELFLYKYQLIRYFIFYLFWVIYLQGTPRQALQWETTNTGTLLENPYFSNHTKVLVPILFSSFSCNDNYRPVRLQVWASIVLFSIVCKGSKLNNEGSYLSVPPAGAFHDSHWNTSCVQLDVYWPLLFDALGKKAVFRGYRKNFIHSISCKSCTLNHE